MVSFCLSLGKWFCGLANHGKGEQDKIIYKSYGEISMIFYCAALISLFNDVGMEEGENENSLASM